MSQIPSEASRRSRRADDRYKTCPICSTADVDGNHVDWCRQKRDYLEASRAAGEAAGLPQPTVDDLHAHLVSRFPNDYVATLVVHVVINLGWRPVVGNDEGRLWVGGGQ